MYMHIYIYIHIHIGDFPGHGGTPESPKSSAQAALAIALHRGAKNAGATGASQGFPQMAMEQTWMNQWIG